MDERKVIYLLGDPVAHSLSPAFQNAALRALGLPWNYVARRVVREKLPAALRELRQSNAAGANITVPHKVAAIDSLDALDTEAAITGAVNTVTIDEGALIGHNTDVDGFLAALEEARPEGLARPAALVLGAGGAARAAVRGLVRERWVESLLVVSRSPEKGQRLIEIVGGGAEEAGPNPVRLEVLASADAIRSRRESVGLVVNATPVGMGRRAHETPLPDLGGFRSDTLIFDLVYGPEPTRLLRDASAAGLPTEDGLNMLLYQGARSLALWTGCKPPLEAMREALQRAVLRVERR